MKNQHEREILNSQSLFDHFFPSRLQRLTGIFSLDLCRIFVKSPRITLSFQLSPTFTLFIEATIFVIKAWKECPLEQFLINRFGVLLTLKMKAGFLTLHLQGKQFKLRFLININLNHLSTICLFLMQNMSFFVIFNQTLSKRTSILIIFK